MRLARGCLSESARSWPPTPTSVAHTRDGRESSCRSRVVYGEHRRWDAVQGEHDAIAVPVAVIVVMAGAERDPRTASPCGPTNTRSDVVQTLALRSNAVRLGSVSSSAPGGLSAACGLRPALWLQGQVERQYSENKRVLLGWQKSEASFGTEHGRLAACRLMWPRFSLAGPRPG
jgi:hypothetical protein